MKWYRRVTLGAGIGALTIYVAYTFADRSGTASASRASLINSDQPVGVGFRLLIWVFLIGGALFVVWLVLSYLILPLLSFAMIPLAPLSAVVSMGLGSMRGAEQVRMLPIKTPQDVESVLPLVKRLFRGIFSPKLLVLTVAHPVWQPTVSRLIGLTSVTLADVTVPTASLLWEINELNRRPDSRVVFIAHQNSSARLSGGATLDEPGSIEEDMRRLLDDQDVLIYTTDRRGLRRFAGALHATLEAAV